MLNQSNCPTANEVATHIIFKANELVMPVTNLKLNKILYILNVICMLDKGYHNPLFKDKFHQFTYGPIQKTVYDNYQDYGAKTIDEPFPHINLQNYKVTPVKPNEFIDNYPTETKFIDDKLSMLLLLDQWELVDNLRQEPQYLNHKAGAKYSNKLSYQYYRDKQNQFWLKQVNLNIYGQNNQSFDVTEVARYVVLKANELNFIINNLKLNYVLYLLNVIYMLQNHDYQKPLFKDKFIKGIHGVEQLEIFEEYKFTGIIEKPFPHFYYQFDNNTKMVTNLSIDKDINIDGYIKKYPKETSFINQWLPTILAFETKDLNNFLREETQQTELTGTLEISNQESYDYYRHNVNQFWLTEDKSISQLGKHKVKLNMSLANQAGFKTGDEVQIIYNQGEIKIIKAK